MELISALLVFTLVQASVGRNHGKWTGVYSTFPKYRPLPLKLSEAVNKEGYLLQKNCSSPADQYGMIYSKSESRFLPGLMYNTHGQLSGMVFGVNRTQLFKPNEVCITYYSLILFQLDTHWKQ